MVSKKIKLMLANSDKNISDLAQLLETSRPNLSQKLKRDNFSEKEMLEISEALGYDLEINFIDRESGAKF